MKKNSPIKFIYFDLGGVIIDNEQTKKGLYRDFKLDPNAVQQFFDENWRESCSGVLDNKTYLARFKKRFRIEHPKDDFADFISDYQGHYQETHDLIHNLINTYYLGILSNAEQGIIEALFRKGKIPEVGWHTIVDSSKEGAVKPDKKIYDIASQKAKVAPREILFIDDKKPNIDAARALGWNTLLFDFFDIKGSITRVKKVLIPRR